MIVSNQPPIQIHPDVDKRNMVAFINENFRKVSQANNTVAWVPTITGFSSAPTGGIYTYNVAGKLVTLFIRMPNNGTSNATGFTLTLPVAARTITNMVWVGYGTVVDNGTTQTAPGMLYIASAGTTLTVYKDAAGNVFTGSGNKRLVYGSITYEIE